MSNPEPSIRVNVDPTNPGQFFACCGLLELADRMCPGAEGWFEQDAFLLGGCDSLKVLLEAFVEHLPQEVTLLGSGLPVKPLIAPLKFSLTGTNGVLSVPTTLTLDAWMTIAVVRGKVGTTANPPWNFWSGQQTTLQIWRVLRAALAEQLKIMTPRQMEDLFTHRVMLSGRFGFDPGAAWNALDVGFSPNEHGMEVASSAAVEMLAATGVQRFRPSMADDHQSFVYATWGQPLAPFIAAAAASGIITISPANRFRGRVTSRGSYAALGRSTHIRGENNE